MQRDLYIDYAKGLATLSIIFIHTAFWSGQFYIPAEVRVLSLLFDVPLFFALSGITSGSNVEKTLFRLLKLQITYMIFVTLLFFLDYFFKVFGLSFFSLQWLQDFYSTFGGKYVPQNISAVPQWQNLGNWYLHSYTNADTFPVVMGSFWYLKVYYILTVLGVLVLRFFPNHVYWFIGLCFGLTLLFNFAPQYYPTGQVGYVAFYLGLFLLANRLKGKMIPKLWIPVLYGLFFIVLGFLMWHFAMPATPKNPLALFDSFLLNSKMNKAKFPPRLLYIFWASFSLITLFVFYNRLKINKNSFITFIGTNAIFFYFAQGISSSFLYFFVVALQEKLPWWLLMVLGYLLNVVMAVGIALLLKKIDELGWRTLRYLQQKTAA